MKPIQNCGSYFCSDSVLAADKRMKEEEFSRKLYGIPARSQLKNDVFQKQNKPEEKSFFQKHSLGIGIGAIAAGPMIGFAGYSAAILGVTSLAPVIMVAGAALVVAGIATALTDGFSKT